MQSNSLTVPEVRNLTLEAVSGSVQRAFETMTGLAVTLGPELSHETDRSASDTGGRVVASIIGWVGHWSGTGVLECTPEFACMLANRLLGTESLEVDEDGLSCVSEMANIIFGNMKTDLEGVLGEMRLGIPTVIYGERMGMWSPLETFLLLPVRIDRHFLRVKVCMVCEARKDQSRSTSGCLFAGCNTL